MKKTSMSDSARAYEAEATPASPEYVLRLYVTGVTPASTRALANLKTICELRLKGRYWLEVVDIFQHPELAREAQIVAAPTLEKEKPLPVRRFIGDLENLEGKLLGFELRGADARGSE